MSQTLSAGLFVPVPHQSLWPICRWRDRVFRPNQPSFGPYRLSSRPLAFLMLMTRFAFSRRVLARTTIRASMKPKVRNRSSPELKRMSGNVICVPENTSCALAISRPRPLFVVASRFDGSYSTFIFCYYIKWQCMQTGIRFTRARNGLQTHIGPDSAIGFLCLGFLNPVRFHPD